MAGAHRRQVPDDVIDALYAQAGWLWDHGQPEAADATAELADVLDRKRRPGPAVGVDTDAW
ncbi:MAG: hypothetical protein GEU93_09915 [Propionibacteriales bacterium]|nr:hypothetical protein [Propionibacteriales bacterium]